MKTTKLIPVLLTPTLVIAILTISTSIFAQPTVKIDPETTKAFDSYERILTAEFFTDVKKKGYPRILLDDPDLRIRTRSGEILVKKGQRTPDIPGGIIHDWIGGMFIPGITIEDIVGVITDYENHKNYYPEVEESRLISKEGNKIRSFLRLRKKKVLTVVLNTEHELTVYPRDGDFQYLLSFSTRIQEVRNPGKSDEYELPVGEDSGFLWRMDAAWILEACEDGVMVELGTTSLSRDIPWGLGWMIRPFIESTPREALEATLQATRLVVVKQKAN